MGLLSLPPEISEEILSHLESLEDVSSLSRSCRQMRVLCNMPVRKKFQLIRVWPNDRGIEQAFSLMMEILKAPHLGRYVREIRYYGRPKYDVVWGSQVNGQNCRDLREWEMDLLIEAIKRAGFPESEWKAVLSMATQKTTGEEKGKLKYYDGYGVIQLEMNIMESETNQILRLNTPFAGPHIAQALAVILISMAPNLVSLGMTQPFASWTSRVGNFPLEAFLSRANNSSESLPYLQSLRKVYMIVDQSGELDLPGYYTHIEFLDCFDLFDKLPSITTVGIDTLTDDQQDEPSIKQRQSNLTELCITHSNISTPYMAHAILACKVLKKFQYSVGGRGEYEVRSFDKKTVMKALFAHKSSLETLDIDAGIVHWDPCWRGDDNLEPIFLHDDMDDEDAFEDGEEDDPHREFLGSFWGNTGTLKDFASLKNLSVGIDLLFYLVKSDSQLSRERTNVQLVDGIPNNLEHLCIRGYERGKFPSWDKEIDALMSAFDSGATSLKNIRGVDVTIPPSEHVHDPEDDRLWALDKIGYGIECDDVSAGPMQELFLNIVAPVMSGLARLKNMI